MKKTILAVTTLSILMASGMANAAFTDADLVGGWTGSVELNGAILNTAPVWRYQIPDATVEAAKNWDSVRTDGVVNGPNVIYSFTDKDFTVLEGAMKETAAAPNSGMQPIVTFGQGDGAIVWDTTVVGGSNDLVLDAKDGESNVGTLKMTISAEVAMQYQRNEMRIMDVHYESVPRAFQLLKAQPYYNKTYGSLMPKMSSNVNNTILLAQPDPQQNSRNLSAALIASANNFELTVPTASIPDTWTATLPISITVK